MIIRDILQLSHREYVAYRTRSRATVITIGALFGILFAVLFITQGLENVVLKYAGYATHGEIYLVSDYKNANNRLIFDRLRQYDGEVITLTDEQKSEIDEVIPESFIIAKFTSLKKAYNYYRKTDAKILRYNAKDYQITELFSNQTSVYGYFQDLNYNFIRPISIVLLIVSILILAFTLAHLISSNAKTFILYCSLGATKAQLLLIYLAYLLELCFRAIIFAIGLALILAGITTAMGWSYLGATLAMAYPQAPQFWPILIGINWQFSGIILCMFFATLASFLLCLDQFSAKKLAQKLKGD